MERDLRNGNGPSNGSGTELAGVVAMVARSAGTMGWQQQRSICEDDTDDDRGDVVRLDFGDASDKPGAGSRVVVFLPKGSPAGDGMAADCGTGTRGRSGTRRRAQLPALGPRMRYDLQRPIR